MPGDLQSHKYLLTEFVLFNHALVLFSQTVWCWFTQKVCQLKDSISQTTPQDFKRSASSKGGFLGKLLNTFISGLHPDTFLKEMRVVVNSPLLNFTPFLSFLVILPVSLPHYLPPSVPLHQCNEQIMATRERCREKNWSHYVSSCVKRAALLSVNSNPQLSLVLTSNQTQRGLFPHVHLLIISPSFN